MIANVVVYPGVIDRYSWRTTTASIEKLPSFWILKKRGVFRAQMSATTVPTALLRMLNCGGRRGKVKMLSAIASDLRDDQHSFTPGILRNGVRFARSRDERDLMAIHYR
jgi:hypothetical protein